MSEPAAAERVGTTRGAPPVPVTVITHLGDCAGRRHDAPHLIVARIAVVPILKDGNSSIIGCRCGWRAVGGEHRSQYTGCARGGRTDAQAPR